MIVANAVWCHNPLIVATMYNTHQGVTHASGVTHMFYYIIVIIINITAIVIIVTSKMNIASFDVFVIIAYHQVAIHLG
jgi:cytochrome b561